MRFKVGDKAVVTETIRRKDSRAVVFPGDVVTIIGVYNAESGNQIVDIQPSGDRPKMIDIVIFDGSDKPLRPVSIERDF